MPSTTTTTSSSRPSTFCVNATHVLLLNGSCVTKDSGQESSYNILINGTANSTVVTNNLINYFESTANNNNSNANLFLPLNRVDALIETLNTTSFTIGGASTFIMVQQRSPSEAVFVLGAAFQPATRGEIVNTNNRDSILTSNISAAAVVNNQSLINIKSLRMFIIDEPTIYRNIDNSTGNKTVASSVIVTSLQSFNNMSNQINISLYFKTFSNSLGPNNGTFLCSFYNTNTYRWNESGCTVPLYNTQLSRYECSCDHATSFALIWLPASLLESYGRALRPADIASLVCQSLSIVCFLAIIIHAIVIRVANPLMSLHANDLLPLISCASTIILFIFYIALGMTVYTQTTSASQTQCFLSASVLMFFVYFFLIFMFCAKTSVGYFNYLRFVYLFPQPSYRQLFIILTISFFLSVGWVSFAAGFHSNSSYDIIQLYPYRLCWFTHRVIYYFLTIPVGIFLLLNLIMIIFVGKHIVEHARNATSPHQSYERMKRCVLILLSSCVTQGIAWLFGPFLTFVNPTAGNVLEWFFIILNALEGVWSILLYVVIRLQRIDEQKRVTAATAIIKSSSAAEKKSKKTSKQDNQIGSKAGKDGTGIIQRKVPKESSDAFDDLSKNKTLS